MVVLRAENIAFNYAVNYAAFAQFQFRKVKNIVRFHAHVLNPRDPLPPPKKKTVI